MDNTPTSSQHGSDKTEEAHRGEAFETLLREASKLDAGDRVIAGCALWRQGGTRMPDDLDVALASHMHGEPEGLAKLEHAFPNYHWCENRDDGPGSKWTGTASGDAPRIDAHLDPTWLYREPAVIDPTGARLAALTDIAALKLWLVGKRMYAKDVADLKTIEALKVDCERAARIAVEKIGVARARTIATRCEMRGLTRWAKRVRQELEGFGIHDLYGAPTGS